MGNPVVDADRIATISLSKFRNLPKTGKPNPGAEWTVLSCILQHQSSNDRLDVVAMGTGTKCLSGDALSISGDRLNDSHAEVVARRAFLRYLLDQMHEAICDKSQSASVFEYKECSQNFRLKYGISFHFFTTHPPCGDGSIFEEVTPDINVPKRAKLDNISSNNIVDNGIALTKVDGFTGGKLLNLGSEDLDKMAQHIGAVRTKPGRGTRTMSVSCSDKLSRWSFVGIQGAMLMTLLDEPIYLESISISGGCNVESIERAVWKRWEGDGMVESKVFALKRPIVQRTSSHIVFGYEQKEGLQAASSSIAWCRVNDR